MAEVAEQNKSLLNSFHLAAREGTPLCCQSDQPLRVVRAAEGIQCMFCTTNLEGRPALQCVCAGCCNALGPFGSVFGVLCCDLGPGFASPIGTDFRLFADRVVLDKG